MKELKFKLHGHTTDLRRGREASQNLKKRGGVKLSMEGNHSGEKGRWREKEREGKNK